MIPFSVCDTWRRAFRLKMMDCGNRLYKRCRKRERADLKSCHVGHRCEMEVHVSSMLVLPPNWTLVEARRPWLLEPDLLLRKLWLLEKLRWLLFCCFWNLAPGTRGVFLPKMCLKIETLLNWNTKLYFCCSLHLGPNGHMREGRSSIKEVEHDDRHDDRNARDCHHSR